MDKRNSNSNFSSGDKTLLEVINSSYLTIEDVKWLKSKWWFKRFLKIYSKELKKRYNTKEEINKTIPKEESIEVLDFTQNIKIPKEEVIEILDFTRTLDITDVGDVVKASDKAKKKVKFEKNILTGIIMICIFIILMILTVIVNWFIENKNIDKTINDINTNIKTKVVTTKTDVAIPEDLYEKYGNMNMLEVDFNKLKKINKDTVGWIKVEGTNINYPFVKTTDNEYYLKHSYDKSKNKKGWVFLDYRNNIDKLGKNTILYAHGLTNNQMFGSMRNIVTYKWYSNKNNRIIKISTPKSNQLWEVFSTYTIEPESYYITTNFDSNESYYDFISMMKKRSVYNYGVDVTINDKILTLSSCYNNSKRMVLHAKLIMSQSR